MKRYSARFCESKNKWFVWDNQTKGMFSLNGYTTREGAETSADFFNQNQSL